MGTLISDDDNSQLSTEGVYRYGGCYHADYRRMRKFL
jgi:hypothetical protein